MIFSQTEKIKLFHMMEDVSQMYSGLDVHVYEDYENVGMSIREGKSAIIWINPEYDFQAETTEEQKVYLFGVFTHELMHILRTDFDFENDESEMYPLTERSIRHKMANIIEDPAIEFFADQHVGEFLLECLRCVISKIWSIGPVIQSGTDAYEQFLVALIQFCDVGLLKGAFTFSSANEAFCEAVKVADKAIEEPDFCKRYQYAMKIFEIVKPLWVEHQKRMDANRSESNILDRMGKSVSGKICSGKPLVSDSSSSGKHSTFSKNRKSISSELEKNSGKGSASIIPAGSQQMDRKDNGDADQSGGGQCCQQVSQQGSQQGDTDSGRQDDSNNSYMPVCLDYPVPKELLNEMKRFTKEGETEPVLQDPDRFPKESVSKTDENDNNMKIDVESPFLEGIEITSMEKEVINSDYSAYMSRVEKNRSEIESLTVQLRKLFQEDRERKEYRTNGKVDIKRSMGSRKVTARIFARKISPSDKMDMSVCVLIDLSASMSSRLEDLKNTCTILTEALSKFHVKAKVIGFSSGICGVDSLHYHFGTWNNTLQDRKNLEEMKYSGETFLGYAVRYATGVLKKQKEKHKLFIIVTDGKPQYKAYRNRQDGLDDFADAVRKSKFVSDVIGIGIFDKKTEEKYGKYFTDFCFLDNTSDLAHIVSSKLRFIIKKW